MLKKLTGQRLTKKFFQQPTLTAARQLLGKYLIVNRHRHLQIGRIVETEAYFGPEDQASHAFRGRTERNKIMWGSAGRLYVYLIYGMYYCLNIVTERKGYPAAILIRAIDPISGIKGKTDGPGKLCRQLGITTKDTGLDITESNEIYIKDIGQKPKKIMTTPRVGVNYAGKWAKKKWRFLAASINQTV
jgi:DNA-3-methyladenine glycosylase